MDDYKKLRAALKRVTIDTELKMDPSTSKTTKAEFMSEDQLNALLDYVWEKAQNFAEKLMHLYVISSFLYFCFHTSMVEMKFHFAELMKSHRLMRTLYFFK